MIQDRNIVCIASSWFDHPTSKHHVMRLLSQHNHVIWVNFHASRKPQLNRRDASLIWRRLARVWDGPKRVAPEIDVLSPVLLPQPESQFARGLNGRILARQIRRALHGLPDRPTQLWLFTPDVPELIGRVPAECVVYYCVDDFAAFAGYNAKLVEQLERRTMAASDVVFTTSEQLYEGRKDRHPNVHLIQHGVDFEHFAGAVSLPEDAIPEDLKPIPRPIFGYMGLISEWVDLDVVGRAARARPEWSFVLLGEARCDLDAVASLSNVHRLGGKPYEQLPTYCRGFDVGLIPFRMNRLIRAVNPIKLREYLAAGLPVVSSPMTEVLRYAPAVQTAQSPAEFIAACERALAIAGDGCGHLRQDLVRSESWASRVETMSEIIARSVACAHAAATAVS